MRHLRHALESESNEEKTVVMKGPLSEVYTEALNIAYAKDDPVTGEAMTMAMESQAMDVSMMKKLAGQLAPATPVESQFMTVYGVNQATLDEQQIVEVTQELADAASSDKADDFVLIIDGTQSGVSGEIEEKFIQLSQGLESIAVGFGIKVYNSLHDFARTR